MALESVPPGQEGPEPGDHLCWVYETDQEHGQFLPPFLRQGLQRGEKVLYLADAGTAETVLGDLRDGGLEAEPYLASGQLAVLPAEEVYVRGGQFDPDKMIALLRSQTQRAVAEGYSALRITGEMTWARRGRPGSERLIEYERKLNESLFGIRCLALCQYDRRRFEPGVLLDVLRTHPIAVIGTQTYENHHYVPPADRSGPGPAASELRLWLEGLAERKQAEQALSQSEERYRALVDDYAEGIVVVQGAEVKFVNRALLDMLGCRSRKEIVGRPFTDFVYPEYRGLMMRRGTDRENGRPATRRYEFKALRRDGTRFDAELSVSRITYRGSAAWQGVVRDTTERRRAEEALRKEHARAQQYLDVAGVMLLAVDADETITLINPTGCRILGYGREELLGRNWFDTCLPERTRDPMRAVFRKLMTGEIGDVAYRESPILARSGEERAIAWHHSVLTDPQGRTVGAFYSGTDITERERAEAALQDSEEKYRLVSENIPVVVYSALPDAHSTSLFISGRVEELTGYSGAEFVADAKLWARIIHPEDRGYVWDRLGEHREERGPFTAEYRIITRGNVTKWIRDSATPMLDEQGQIVRIDGFMEDITDRKQAEEALRESERKSRSLIQVIPDQIFRVKRDGTFLDVPAGENSALALPETDLRGKRIGELFPDHLARPALEAAERALAEDALQVLEYEMPIPLGSENVRHFEARVIPCGPDEVLAIARDITERKQAEEQVKASLREKEVLLKEIHHRVKNNLQVICSLLDLQSENLRDEEAREAHRESCNRVRSMARIHEQLYRSEDFGRIDMGRYITGLATALRQSYDARTIDAKVEIPPHAFLGIDRAIPCGLIVNELVSNALKHAFPDGASGEVRIRLRHDDGRFELIVADNGVGLPADLDPADPKSLGLRLVEMLTRQLDGDLEVDRGGGTTFRIAFAAPEPRSRATP